MPDPILPCPAPDSASARGLTVADLARRYRVSEDKVRTWIKRGELRAINTASASCARPRFVVPPEALSAFEQRRAGSMAPNPPRKRRRQSHQIDFYPDKP